MKVYGVNTTYKEYKMTNKNKTPLSTRIFLILFSANAAMTVNDKLYDHYYKRALRGWK